MDLNEKIGFVIFKNNSLYINSHSLWELMQPIGGKGGHHYHELIDAGIDVIVSGTFLFGHKDILKRIEILRS